MHAIACFGQSARVLPRYRTGAPQTFENGTKGEKMAFDSSAFCWNGVVSTAARQFYAATIGWQAEEHQFPNGDTSTMFVAGGVPRAHLRAPGHDREPCG